MSSGAAPRGPIVVDASAIVRLALTGSPYVESVVASGRAAAPAFMLFELANSLVKQVRFRGLDAEAAQRHLLTVCELPISYVPDGRLVSDSQRLAVELGLSAYDASYVALAARREATLVTADRRLAAAYSNTVLLP